MTQDDRPRRGPVLIEDDALAAPAASPYDAPPPEPSAAPPAVTAGQAARGRGGGWVWGAVLGLGSLALSVWLWDFVAGLLARNPALGAVAGVLAVVVVAGLAAFAAREVAALARLAKVDRLRAAVAAAPDRAHAVRASAAVAALYAGRRELDWALAEEKARRAEAVDAPDVLAATERALMTPLDEAARAEVARAARQAAGAAVIIPYPVVDAAAALAVTLRMVRRVAAVYGGRGGWLGSLRLARAVLGAVLAAGAVSLGEDVAGSAVGGGLAGALSRRLGEGVLVGALTARVGVAAIEVCRPMPFGVLERPSWRSLAAQAAGA